jgi:hypothetical protein
MAAAILILCAILYPPYYSKYKEGEWTYSNSGWIFIYDFVKNYRKFFPKIRFDILSLEIFGILVMAGAGFLISKKK